MRGGTSSARQITVPVFSRSRLFVSSVARYRNQHGELLAINRETIVYQPLQPQEATL